MASDPHSKWNPAGQGQDTRIRLDTSVLECRLRQPAREKERPSTAETDPATHSSCAAMSWRGALEPSSVWWGSAGRVPAAGDSAGPG